MLDLVWTSFYFRFQMLPVNVSLLIVATLTNLYLFLVFIYVTIEQFGPVVFAVVMTIRQILSIVLSTIYFSHPINFIGVIGLALAFGALIVDSYFKFCRMRGSKPDSKH
jgi:hypothetical protein